MAHRSWTRDELLLAFNLYCRLPFGRMHRGNFDIVALARGIGRTPSAVAMKLVNFASFDPAHQARNVSGLSNTSRSDKGVWDEFNANPEELAYESQRAYSRVVTEAAGWSETESNEVEPSLPEQTEGTRLVRIRLVQRFFRESVLSSYEYRCAFCLLDLPELLNASHIVPWRVSVERRADPRNGLALCAIHDRAFDRGLLTVTERHTVATSGRAKAAPSGRLHDVALIEVEGQPLAMPKRFLPDPVALAYHREHIFGK